MNTLNIYKNQNTRNRIDGTIRNEHMNVRIYPSYADNQAMLKKHRADLISSSTLFSRGKRTRSFYTEDSHRYITTREREDLENNVYRYERSSYFDSVQIRYVKAAQGSSELLVRQLEHRYADVLETIRFFPEMIRSQISPMRMWNASIVGAIFFGMFSMTLIYKYLGQQASAEEEARLALAPASSQVQAAPQVLGATIETIEADEAVKKTPVIDTARIAATKPPQKDADQERFETEAKEMVKGYPIEKMLPAIFKQDRLTATYLIAIAKKESAWGKRVPVRNGHDCYNYWGYRGIREKMGTGGHTCFDGPEDAVKTVAKRINTLVNEKKLNTPAKMIVWKCGSSCAGHGSESVRKWISDVDMYVQALK